MRAFGEYLHEIKDDELPEEVQESFATLRRRMHSCAPANGEGPVCASVRKMSKVEADECAELIVRIFGDVARYSDASRAAVAPLMRSNGNGADLPPFLVKSG